MLEHGIAPATGVAYEIDSSLRFNDDDSAHLSWTPTSAGNRKTWTWSGWVKRGNLGVRQTLFSASADGNNENWVSFNTDDTLFFYNYESATQYQLSSSAKYRDTSAWYHIVAVLDTTQANSSDRVKLYVNGSLLSSFTTEIYPSQNFDGRINNTVSHATGRSSSAYPNYTDGHIAEVNFIDGQALDPSNFGETGDYGEWKPKKYTGTYGTNGFYLDFENSGSLGADVSGNGNNWTPTNLAATDQMLDSPTNNFCTLNAVDSDATLSEGNLKANCPNGGVTSTFPVSSGKWYLEFLMLTQGGTLNGWVEASYSASTSIMPHDHGDNAMFYTSTAQKVIDNAFTAYGSTIAANDIVGVAVDLDGNTIQFYKNGVSQGSFSKTFNGQYIYTVSDVTTVTNSVSVHNFGQDSSFAGNKTTGSANASDGNGYGDFYYTPPTGYLALCTQNLPDPAVIPSEHFSAKLFTGNQTTNVITGVGFQPDLVWTKARASVYSHMLYDAVRGVNKYVMSDRTNAEGTATNALNSFDSDGFTLGGEDNANWSNGAAVAWNWKANGSGVSNTDGTITSTVSANTSAGFSIVSYTGTGVDNATVGHGLSQAPEMVIVKNRIDVLHWFVHHQYNGASPAYSHRLLLNDTGARTYDIGWFNADPTSSVLQLGTSGYTNGVSDDMIAYCFHSVDGFSKVGSYTGNGSTDGTFVYTSFAPRFVLTKRTDTASQWRIWDTERDTYNVADKTLLPNDSSAEVSGATYYFDILSNGFKHRSSTPDFNASGGTYIYIAFAESPFKHTNAR